VGAALRRDGLDGQYGRGIKPLLQIPEVQLVPTRTCEAHHPGRRWTMPFRLETATIADAAAIASVRMVSARDLTARFGCGTWSFVAESEGGVRMDMLTSHILVARTEGTIVATLRLSTRSPWLGKIDFFTPAERPLYLTSMAVAPKWQGCGIGRACLEEVKRIAGKWDADAIRLDAYEAKAGAGEFYRKCGYREVRRAAYNGTPLIYFELMLAIATSVAGARAIDDAYQT
jgi:GNAT superfamily N-acetyltransferase